MREALFGDYPIPDDTRRVAHPAFPNGNLYLQLRDSVGRLVDNQRFAHLFSHQGKPALAPARRALVLLLQFLENLSDQQAAEAVRDRISWTYLLGLPLDDPGFHPSVLSEFRTRLLRDDVAALLLDAVLDRCRDTGLLKARSKQRTDSTYILATIRALVAPRCSVVMRQPLWAAVRCLLVDARAASAPPNLAAVPDTGAVL
jgi:transposase